VTWEGKSRRKLAAKLGLDVLAGCGIRDLKIRLRQEIGTCDVLVLNAFGSIEHGYLPASDFCFKARRDRFFQGSTSKCLSARLPGKMELLVCAPEKLGNQKKTEKDNVENER